MEVLIGGGKLGPTTPQPHLYFQTEEQIEQEAISEKFNLF